MTNPYFTLATDRYVQKVKEHKAKLLIRSAWRPYNHWQLWKSVGYKLGRIKIVLAATTKLQTNWRRYNTYEKWYEAYKVRHNILIFRDFCNFHTILCTKLD